ncbi:MAG: succinylglutamate desuccinylase/aspartoacylase family protein [Enterobacterales bacterium]|nr:succinylglutamate desuccinylase/aspartoacylase family protein [Enterobacterales bacterium]
MIPLNSHYFYFDDSSRNDFPDAPIDFLRSLEGLTVIDINGVDQSRCRVVTTLIHGNEPSGFIAVHLWLTGQQIPAVNLRIIICNPEAAQLKPLFSHRFINNSYDLNRFFSHPRGLPSPVAQRASKIMQLVKEVSPEAIIDIHNTSGASPSFSVSVNDNSQHLELAALFNQKIIITELEVGAIMEQDLGAPIITVECGGANDKTSHTIATNGLQMFFQKTHVFDNDKLNVIIYKNPVRVALTNDASVGFANQPLATTDITLRQDIEDFNHRTLEKGEFIGWCQSKESNLLSAQNHLGKELITHLIQYKQGQLYAASDQQLFMVTNHPEIATKDCLFYSTPVHS